MGPRILPRLTLPQPRRLLRPLLGLLALFVLVPLSGCEWLKFGKEKDTAPKFSGPIPRRDKAELVAYLNQQASLLRTVSYTDVSATIIENGGELGTLNDSELYSAQPRYFRLIGKHTLGGRFVDIGSNDREFWMYAKPIGRDNFFYCSHDDYSRGAAQLPVPFDPDWVMMALGMTNYDPAAEYETQARDREGTYVLYQKTTTRKGDPVTKATVFNVDWNSGKQPAVKSHIIYDARNQVLCQASIKSVRTITTRSLDGNRPAMLQIPTQVVLSWPQQKFEMDMRLGGEKVNDDFSDTAAKIFQRPKISGSTAIDLATYNFRPASYRGQSPRR
jgi:hypothetical protein